MDSARLPEARARFPEWALCERMAEQRLRVAVAEGDIPAGSQALADWIDAQAVMLACLYVEDEHLGHC